MDAPYDGIGLRRQAHDKKKTPDTFVRGLMCFSKTALSLKGLHLFRDASHFIETRPKIVQRHGIIIFVMEGFV